MRLDRVHCDRMLKGMIASCTTQARLYIMYNKFAFGGWWWWLQEADGCWLQQAAESAGVSYWRAAAALTGPPAQPDHSPDPRSREASGSSSSPPQQRHLLCSRRRLQQLRLLRSFSRAALRVSLVAWQCQRESGSAGDLCQLVEEVGELLRDQVVCLAPWYEPWKYKPDKQSLFRALTLQTAKVGTWPLLASLLCLGFCLLMHSKQKSQQSAVTYAAGRSASAAMEACSA